MGHGPYVKLVAGFLFTSLGFMVRADALSFFVFFFWLIPSAPSCENVTTFLVGFISRRGPGGCVAVLV